MSVPSEQIAVAICHQLSRRLVSRIGTMDDRLEVRCTPQQPLSDHTQVAFGWPKDFPGGLRGFVRRYPRLRWVQSLARDALKEVQDLSAEDRARVTFTEAAAADSGPLAEFAMAGILSVAKQLPHALAGVVGGQRHPYPMAELAGSTLLVIGLGRLGVQVAQLGKAFGMRVVGVNRNGRGTVPAVESIRPPRFLGDLLPIAHAVVVTLPRTDGTSGMIGPGQIVRMRRDATLVDVSGGGVVDERSLIEGLRQGQPSAAVLDAHTLGPRLQESALWGLPNVMIGQHTTGPEEQRTERVGALFVGNLRRYLGGDAPRDQVG